MFPQITAWLPQDPFAVACIVLGLGLIWSLVACIRAKIARSRLAQSIADLKEELAKRDTLLEKSRTLCKDMRSLLPAEVMKAATREAREGKFAAAALKLSQWTNEQGPEIAPILLERTRWALLRARGEFRSSALAGAEAFTVAALTLAPQDGEAESMLAEIRALRKAEGRSSPSLPQTLAKLDALASGDKIAPDLFGDDQELLAEDAEADAEKQYDAGRNHIALALIEETIKIRTQINADDRDATLGPLSFKSYVLYALERSDEALQTLRTVADRLADSPDYGPTAPDTLSCRFELALMLDRLDRSAEALAIARDVAERQAASPDLGPDHADTKETQKLIRKIGERMQK